MKIRPTDPSSSFPAEPEGVGKKKATEQFSAVEEASGQAEAPGQVKKSELLSSLSGLSKPEEVGKKFVDLAVDEFEGSVPSLDLDQIRGMLLEHVEEDPFLQSKLERISGLLAESK